MIYQLEGNRLRVPLTDVVLDKLVSLLLSGRLKAGDTLPSESELARSFNVSKPIVRLALRQLAAMGVLDIRQGKPSVVRELDARPLELYLQLAVSSLEGGLEDAVELRRALETRAAALAAARRSDEDVKRLQAILRTMSDVRMEHEAWIAADIEFHAVIARASGNSLIKFLNQALHSTMHYVIGTLHARKDMRNADETVARHREIVDAIERRDVAAAQRAMNDHFDKSVPIAAQIQKETRKATKG
jgi:GntR family transcriptional repressor for pyruvate dehydrogenase complex